MISRFLTSFLRTDIAYLAKGSFWLSIHKAASISIALLLSIAYARYLPKETYGDYRYVLSFLGMLGIFAIPGMGTALIQSVARGFAGTYKNASKIIFLSSFGISAVCAITALYFFAQGNISLTLGFLAAALFAPASEGLGSWHGYLTATKQFKKGSLLSSAIQLFYGLGMLAAVAIIAIQSLSHSISIVLLVGTYLSTHALANIFFSWRVWQNIPPDAPSDPEAIRYGLHFSVSEIPSIVATYLDSLLLYSFLGPSALAVYSFALAPVEQLKGLFGTAASVSMPKLAEKTAAPQTRESVRKLLPSKLYRASALTAVGVFAYIIAAPFLFQILFPRYIEAVPFTQILAVSLILFPLGVFGTALKAEGAIKEIYAFSIGTPLIQILAMLILIPLYGLWGAVLARVGGRLFHHALLTFLYLRCRK